MSTDVMPTVGRTLEAVAEAVANFPAPVAEAVSRHQHEDGNEWSPVECPSLIGDAAYYVQETAPALVLWFDFDEGQGFLFIEGHPDDAEGSANNCRSGYANRRAWWCPLTPGSNYQPEWREVGA